jgi:hypothetical protein
LLERRGNMEAVEKPRAVAVGGGEDRTVVIEGRGALLQLEGGKGG